MGKRNCNPFDYYNSEFQRERKSPLRAQFLPLRVFLIRALGSKIARLESFREREKEQVEEFVRRLIPDQRFSFAVFANTS